MEGLAEPLPPGLHASLRRAALDHALSERRRVFTPALHVGTPGGPQAVLALTPGERLDHALRTDVVAALRHRVAAEVPAPVTWLTRPGDLALQDLDALWLAAARAACGEAGITLTLVVVSRHGWRDPRSGLTRTWRRLRRR
jgi:hypothetical protein